MRKSLYYLTRTALLVITMLMVNSLLAQETLVWTGAVSTDATDPSNWEPQLAITDNILSIDSAYKFTNLPVFSGADSIYINNLTLTQTAEMTISLDDSLTLFSVAAETPTLRGFINIDKGTMDMRRVEIRDTIGAVNIYSGGILRVRKYLFISDRGNSGGFVNMFGTGHLLYTAEQDNFFGRFDDTDNTRGVYSLDVLSTMSIKYNYYDLISARIDSNQVKAPAGYDVIVNYDGAGDWTYVSCRSKQAFVIAPADNQFIITNEVASKVGMVQNDGYAGTTTFEWKHAANSGGPYLSFTTPVTTDSIEAVFDTPGKYYVVCVGDGTKTSNEIVFFVGSDKVTISPSGEQFLRPEKDGAMLTVTKDAAITGVEWKWSTTPGEGHVSFDPAVTGDEFTPNFVDGGLYYVICEGVDASSATYPSKDVKIKVDESTYNIYWKGTNGSSAHNVDNWDPQANVDGNKIYVQAPETYTNILEFSGDGNTNISKIYLEDTLSTMLVDMGSDTLRVSGNSYGIHGELIVTSGILSYNDLRHERTTGRIIVKNTGEFLVRSSYFMTGNKSGSTGAHIDIMDDGKFISIEQQPGRWSLDTLMSVITITGNGMFQVPGDYRGGAETYMAKNQIITSDLEVLVVTYPVLYGEDTVTQITAKSLLVFEVSPADDQLVGIDEAVAAISTLNDEDLTGVEWKFATVSGGPYASFSPAETGNSFSASFDAADDYYVICEGYGDVTVFSSEVYIQVVGIAITPDSEQNILVQESGTPLTVAETATADSREWKSSATSGSGYTPVVPPQSGDTYTPLFLTAGTYYVVCASTFGTKTLNSNEVTIIVTDDISGIEDNMTGVITLYPNPAKGTFFLDAGDYTSYDVKVTDMSGRTVLTREYINASGPQQITINGSGIYFINIITADGISTAKMVLK